MKQTYEISRPADDPGPKLLVVTGAGRSLRMEKGKEPHKVKLDPENAADAMFLRSVATRYKVEMVDQDAKTSEPAAAPIESAEEASDKSEVLAADQEERSAATIAPSQEITR